MQSVFVHHSKFGAWVKKNYLTARKFNDLRLGSLRHKSLKVLPRSCGKWMRSSTWSMGSWSL